MKQRFLVWMIISGLAAAETHQAAARRLSDFLPKEKGGAAPAPAKASSPPARPQASAAQIQDPRKALEDHGVPQKPKELISFLEQGLSRERLAKLPEEPTEKCQLAIDAMARLAKIRSRDAVPVLISIASAQQLPKGVESLLAIDLAKTSPESREEYRATALRLLQFNAVNALGLIGDQKALDLVRAVYNQETSPAARIQHALSLACLGDATGVDFLLEQIDKLNRRESAAAARVYTIITGQDFGYTENTAVRARRAKARQYRDWWRQNRAQFALNTTEVMERRLTPRAPLSYQPRNTRDLLKLAANYLDFQNSLGSRDARQRIKQAGRAMNSELQRIALDPNEDLDVRMEAMNWHYENNRSDSRNLMLKLRRDENPEIVDKANVLIQQIDEGPPVAEGLTTFGQ